MYQKLSVHNNTHETASFLKSLLPALLRSMKQMPVTYAPGRIALQDPESLRNSALVEALRHANGHAESFF